MSASNEYLLIKQMRMAKSKSALTLSSLISLANILQVFNSIDEKFTLAVISVQCDCLRNPLITI
jgi:hypothetical protein